MSDIDTTKLALRGVGSLLIVAAIRGSVEFAVGYTLPDWLLTVLFVGLIVGYYQVTSQ